MSERPQFYENNLSLPKISVETLRQTLEELCPAVLNGVKIIESGDPPTGEYDGRGIFTGELGIALAYLRLAHQALSLAQSGQPLPDFSALSGSRIPNQGPNVPLRVGGLSPLPSKSPISAVALRILHQFATGNAASISDSDISCLEDAVALALSHGSTGFYHGHHLGADEVLFGRAGLLWVLLNIRSRLTDLPQAQRELLKPAVRRIPEVLRVIIGAGREGATEHVQKHGEEEALPLMWPWKPGHYGIGWAHGLTGIIPILLACRPDELSNTADNYVAEIGPTISGLCRLCIAHDGHLPTTIPPSSSSLSRKSPLVQICHGAPAILGLLGCALQNSDLVLNHWQPEWDHALRLATDRVWEQGLLSKGGGLCHGIAGNAWPFLLLHDALEYNGGALAQAREMHGRSETKAPSADEFLSRAIAMLLHARETQPYNESRGTASYDYRMPDHPYSLYEGLAGTLCAWAETCVLVQKRLRKIEAGDAFAQDAAFEQCLQQQLGFPCMGGYGATGFL
ncbi:lanthionine synthetase C family protein [Aspergillus undulatus]|uniref:lanthionine synthetase C family protein n=1 Tax=Aspergillus undulatus TaxID=1810928 RepID=UPI003CCD164F